MAAPGRLWIADTTLGRLGNVEVSKFETATGVRLRLRGISPKPLEAYLDPLELEGLTRVRYKPFPLLPPGERPAREEAPVRPAVEERMERLQNEFALVGVGVARGRSEEGLLIRDMNAGQAVVLTPDELEALLRARHMDFAPLVDTSDLIALPEPDIDEA
ncbi:MAG: hypothetical protein HY334_03125 [Armatimonadetes bacterium]|nr:hypothetical protein [Armatimonadota bacterium]